MSTYRQAVLALRWFLDNTRITQLARDNGIGKSSAYDYRDEGIDVLAAGKPGLRRALLAAKTTGHTHINMDGTLIYTDRDHAPAPRRGWICGGRASTTTTAATSRSSPPPTGGRCGPPTCDRAVNMTPPPHAPTPSCSPRSAPWVDDGHLGLADLGYEGEADLLRVPIKKTAGRVLNADQQAYNAVHGALRALGERANSLIKTAAATMSPMRQGQPRQRRSAFRGRRRRRGGCPRQLQRLDALDVQHSGRGEHHGRGQPAVAPSIVIHDDGIAASNVAGGTV